MLFGLGLHSMTNLPPPVCYGSLLVLAIAHFYADIAACGYIYYFFLLLFIGTPSFCDWVSRLTSSERQPHYSDLAQSGQDAEVTQGYLCRSGIFPGPDAGKLHRQ